MKAVTALQQHVRFSTAATDTVTPQAAYCCSAVRPVLLMLESAYCRDTVLYRMLKLQSNVLFNALICDGVKGHCS